MATAALPGMPPVLWGDDGDACAASSERLTQSPDDG